MLLKPFEMMQERVKAAKGDSAREYFDSLMLYGEMVFKFAVAGLVSAVVDGRERHQYSLKHRLVRADSIGEWSQVLDQILVGVAAQYLHDEIVSDGSEASQLSDRRLSGTWQHESVTLLRMCVEIAHPPFDSHSDKQVRGKMWFHNFVTLRNKTRGHGALVRDDIRSICDPLHRSINVFAQHYILFQRPWAYLQQTLKGKYNVVRWNSEGHSLDILATKLGRQITLNDGVYIHFGRQVNRESLREVDLITSDSEIDNVHVLNGGWNGKRIEMLSYLTGEKRFPEVKEYRKPVTELADSETQGLSELVETGSHGGTITNLPPRPVEYIRRFEEEDNLYREIVNDTPHHIITLRGRGGIGKTWLTLEVLHRIAQEEHFQAVLWFSSRDIDLSITGVPKQVKPQVLNHDDVADVFKELLGSYILSFEEMNDNSNAVTFLQQNMQNSMLGRILFVFDNFETVASPLELYEWIYQYLGKSNKAVITTRVREFKADFPIELEGMSDEECQKLIDSTKDRLFIRHHLTRNYTSRLISFSEGHPYVIKIVLGEIKKSNRLVQLENIITNHDDLLDSLFERSYNQQLNKLAKRVFLTLCDWNSLVAESALEAVLLRPDNDIRGISEAIDILHDSSFIRKRDSAADSETYWEVPLVASQFGTRKLETSTMKMAIKADLKFLRSFGVTQESDLGRSFSVRIKRLFGEIKSQVRNSSTELESYRPIVEYIAKHRYPAAWLHLAELYAELGNTEKHKETLRNFIEYSTDIHEKRRIWEKLADLSAIDQEFSAELDARIQLAQIPGTSYDKISGAVNRFNGIKGRQEYSFDEGEEEVIVDLLIELMESKIEMANADDCSRLGWLYMQSKQYEKALQAAVRGLQLNPKSDYCLNLQNKARDALSQLPFALS